MRKSNFLIPILVICIFSQVSYSQGYRGRKFSFSYVPGYSMVDPSFDFLHIICHQKLNLGYSFAKHWSLNLIGSYTNSRTMTNPKYEEIQIKDITYGVSINYFKKKHQSFAPVGRYMGLSFEFGSQNLERVEYSPPYYSGGPLQEDFFYNDQNRGKLIIFSANFGKNYLIKDRFLLGYGIQYGFCSKGGPTLRHFIKPQFNLGIIF